MAELVDNVLAWGQDWLADTLMDYCSDSVTYTTPSGSVTLAAIIGRTAFRVVENGRSRIIFSDRDFLFDPAALIIDGSAVTPAVGDHVTYGTESFRVHDFNGEPCQRKSDPFGNLVRVHTLKRG